MDGSGSIIFNNCKNTGTITSEIGNSLKERSFTSQAAGFINICNTIVETIEFNNCNLEGNIVINQKGDIKFKTANYYIGAFHADPKVKDGYQTIGDVKKQINVSINNCEYSKVKYIINVDYAKEVWLADGNEYVNAKTASNSKATINGSFFN